MGDTKTQADGIVDQVAGTAQDLNGQAKDLASNASDAVQKSAKGAQDYLWQAMEEKPYAVALWSHFGLASRGPQDEPLYLQASPTTKLRAMALA
jgi:hypothetical protein